MDGDEALIVVAHDISPADMLRLRGGRFAAFVTDLGGPTSHTAIVARSMGVPAVVALGNVRELVRDGDTLIIDGASGAVVVNPSPRILQEYRRRQSAYADERAELSLLRDVPSVTLDGIDVVLHANIELPEEAALALASGAHGIGLFRSEFLFMGRADLPGEEEQYEAYASVVKVMAGRPSPSARWTSARTRRWTARPPWPPTPRWASAPSVTAWRAPRCSPRNCARSCAPRPTAGAPADTDDRPYARSGRHQGRHRGRAARTRRARPGLCGPYGSGRHGRGAGHRHRH